MPRASALWGAQRGQPAAAERGPCRGASAAGLVLDTAASGGPDLEVLIASFARLSPAGRRHVALVRCMLAAAETAS